MKYNACYYRQFFEKIPEKLWGRFAFFDGLSRYCALGLCGATEQNNGLNKKARSLAKLFLKHGLSIAAINDCQHPEGLSPYSCPIFLQPTAKQRVLAALDYIIETEQTDSAVKEVTELLNKGQKVQGSVAMDDHSSTKALATKKQYA